MRAILLALVCLLASFAQPSHPRIGYKSYEDYCYHNPNMPTCIKGKPLTIDSLTLKPNLPPMQAAASRRSGRAPLPPAQLAAAMPVDWRWADPRSAVFIGIRVRALLESPLLSGQVLSTALPHTGVADAQRILQMLSGIEEIHIAVPSAAPGAKPDPLVLLIGQPSPQFLRFAPRSVPLGANAHLLGEPRAVSDALQRSLSASAASIVFPPGAHIWVAGFPKLAAGLAGTPSSPELDEIRSFALSMTFGSALSISGSLDTASPESAAKLMAFYQLWRTTQKDIEFAPILQQSGNLLSFALTLSEAQMQKAIATRAGAGSPGPAAAGPGAASPQPATPGDIRNAASPAPPAKPGVVRIQGLEPETVEIPYQPKPKN